MVGVTPKMPDTIDQQNLQGSSLLDSAAEGELDIVLRKLKVLPFEYEEQKTVFMENVQRLQDYHVMQVFNLGVAPLQSHISEPSKFLDEVIKLFEICSSFCYTSDLSKRVAFDYYARAVKFCFPSHPKPCLSTADVTLLLKFVQIFQEGKLATIVCDSTEQILNSKMQINGTKLFFGELLEILEKRRDQGYIREIITQSLRFASLDASASCVPNHSVGPVSLRSDHVVSPVCMTNWINLLKLDNVSNDFASALANMEATNQCLPLLCPDNTFDERQNSESAVCYFVSVLEDMTKSGSEVSLPSDEERLSIFFNCRNHLCYHRIVTATSLKLLATTSISNEVLIEILDQFFGKEEQPSQLLAEKKIDYKAAAFTFVFKLLCLLPDGKLVKNLFKIWRDAYPGDPDYHVLACLMFLFVAGSSSEGQFCFHRERAERILNFLECLDSSFLPSITIWHPLLAWFMKEFPSSFHDERRRDVLLFIERTVIAARVRPEQRPAYVTSKQLSVLGYLQWISQQRFSEKIKNEIICLLTCCGDDSEGWFTRHWEFSVNVIVQLSLCQKLSLSTKKVVVSELNSLAKFFNKNERWNFQECVRHAASNPTLELKEEDIFELLGFIKRFAEKGAIPSDALQLLLLLSRVPISGDRKMKVLQMSKKSDEGLLNGARILQLTEFYRYGANEGVNKYFDLFLSTFVDILKEEKHLCEQFFEQQQQKRCSSSMVQFVWSFVVARLISLGLFKEEVDSRCCFPVLEGAWEFSSPFEVLQLISQVRSSAEKVVRMLKNDSNINLSPDILNRVLQTFASSLSIIVATNVLSSRGKLLLVEKVCDIFLSNPASLSKSTMTKALFKIIPFLPTRSSNTPSNDEAMHLELNQIITTLENPGIVTQLARLPSFGVSLRAALSAMTFDLNSGNGLRDIYYFIGSQENIDQAFFEHCVPVLEIAAKVSNSVEDVLEILGELVCIIRDFPSDLIPFIIVNFEHLVKNLVNKQEREGFLKEISTIWNFTPDVHVLSYLEVPRLLWKMHTTVDSLVRRSELTDRMQAVLRKADGKMNMYSAMHEPGIFFQSPNRSLITKRTACCELEWLVVHSSLSNDEAALACELIFSLFKQPLRCFTFSDVQIEDGSFTFFPETTRSRLLTASTMKDLTGNEFPGSQPRTTILTPVLVAQKVIAQVKRVLGQDQDPTETVHLLWNLAFDSRSFKCGSECAPSCSFLDDYVEALLSILAESSSAEMMLHWAKQDKHHICQCSEIILKACKLHGSGEEIDMEVFLNFQDALSTAMKKMRVMRGSVIGPSYRCFRLLKPQLQYLSDLLGSKLPIEVISAVLKLFQINAQAGDTVLEILSSWPCKQQTMELVESVQLCIQEENMSSGNFLQSKFAWLCLKSFGRFSMNSCKDFPVRFKELLALHDLEDHGLNRLPKWREMMIADGFSAHAVDCWCVAFLMTPLAHLSSRDADVIFYLNSHSFQLVVSVSQRIKSCIFPESGFPVTWEEGIKEPQTKERLRLARFLGEFINILKLRKSEDATVADIRKVVVSACDEICKAYENENRGKSDLYKIHRQKLQDLFTEAFGQQSKLGDEVDCASLEHQTAERGCKGVLSVATQSVSLHEDQPRILSRNEIYEPLLVLLRRWLSTIVLKPVLGSRTLEIVRLLSSVHSSKKGRHFLEELHGIIQARLLSFKESQGLIAQLQAVGYNQNEKGTRDLWYSPTVDCAGYLSKRVSWCNRSFRKKLAEVLRSDWEEWKNILSILGIASIKVGDVIVCTRDLFGLQASLEEMEDQVSAVKKAVNQMIEPDDSNDIGRRVNELMLQEKQHRARIEKLFLGKKVRNMAFAS